MLATSTRASKAQTPLLQNTAADAVCRALDLLRRASADWRNGDSRGSAALHWPVAVTLARSELHEALEALGPQQEGDHPPGCICGREHCPGDCLDSRGWDADDDARAGLAWYNSATVTERRYWHSVARSAVPADAWEAYKAGAHP